MVEDIRQLDQVQKPGIEQQTASSLHKDAYDSPSTATPASDVKVADAAGLHKVEIQNAEKEQRPLTPDEAADQLLKNPTVFASVVRSAYTHWNKDSWGEVDHKEITRVAQDQSVDPLERRAAQILDKNFDMFAKFYGGGKLQPRDIDEFSAALRLDSCGVPLSPEAAATAAKWGIGTYAISKAFGSDQAGENAAVSATSSALASFILANVRDRNREKIRALNYFDIPKC